MLLSDPFFRTFTERTPCDTRTHVEALFTFSCEARADVDALVAKAVALGGSVPKPPDDYGFMYGQAFDDPDGHSWKVLWFDACIG